LSVKRIVCNIATENPAAAVDFYRELLGLDLAMDQGWIVTMAAPATPHMPQVSFMSEGGSGTPVPDMSFEVEDARAVYAKATAMGAEIVYHLTDEPWGVRRFYVRDPMGKTLNILSHL
jgi:uncharacterized glyoxalase superfamily protein PhnB